MTGWMAAAVVTLMIRMKLRYYHVIIAQRWLSSGMGVKSSQTGRTWWYACDQCQTCLPDHAPECAVAWAKTCCTAIETGTYRQSGREESNQRWCSDGFEFCCDNGERLRVTFALDCCDREALHWAVTTGGFNSETVQDVMLGAVERRFGNDLPSSPVEWLTDNGSCYRANETRQFARMLGLEPKNTAVRSPESNGIAESFVKTIKRDYISIMPKPDGLTAAKNLAEAFEHYNEWHPHSALGYRSPREYLRQRACNGLSDNRCLEIWQPATKQV